MYHDGYSRRKALIVRNAAMRDAALRRKTLRKLTGFDYYKICLEHTHQKRALKIALNFSRMQISLKIKSFITEKKNHKI